MAKKKKVTVYKMPKAQEGMQMAAEAPQEQQAGAEQQMQQLAQQVQQMLEQGADPSQVVAQLVQGGVPPQVVAQILVGLGMPQEQVMPMIEQVMQQMQGAQQQGPPQENGETEGQPMMEYGDEVPVFLPTKSASEAFQGYREDVAGDVRNRLVKHISDTQPVINSYNRNPNFNAYGLMVNRTLQQDAMNQYGRDLMGLKDGGQAQAEQQAMIEKYIMVYAAMNQVTPQQIAQALQEGQLDMTQLQQAVESPEGQEIAVQLEQLKTQQDGMSPQQQMMQVAMNGGQIDELMMGAINPTKDDFQKIKKKMLKEMKAGGTTKSFDADNTKSFVENFKGGVANYAASNLKKAIAGQFFKEFENLVFDETPSTSNNSNLPQAKTGFEIWAEKQNITGESLSAMTPEEREKIYDAYYAENPVKIKDPVTTTDSKTQGADNLDESVIDTKTDEKSFDDKFDERMRRYHPGWNMYGQDYYDRSIGGRMVRRFGDPRAVTRENTGNYDFTGMGELSGKTGEEAISRIEEVLADPNYAKRIQKGYINRRGKFKKGPGIFNQRPFSYQIDYAQNQYLPVTDKLGTRPEDLEIDSEQTDGETNTQTQQQSTIQRPLAPGVQQFDKYGNPYFSEPPAGTTVYTDPLTGEQMSMAPSPTPIIDEKGRIRTPNETDESLYAQGESDLTAKYINEGMNPRMAARKAKREIALQNPELAGVEERLSRKEQKLANDPYYGKTAQEIYQLVDDPKKAKKLVEKYGAPLESRGVEVLPESELRKDRMNVDVISEYLPQQYLTVWKGEDDDFQKRLASNISKEIYGSKQKRYEGMSESDILDSLYEDRNKGLIRDYGMNAPLYYPEYFKQHGGLVSNPGRPIWDFKQMKWSSPKPAQSLLFAENGLEMLPVETIDEVDLSNTPLLGYDQDGNSVVQGEDGGFRFSEQRKKIVDRKKRGQNIFNTASFINDMILEPAAYLTTSEEAAAERQKMVRPTDVQSGAMGIKNQFGDPRFGQTGNLSAGVRAGTGTDQDVYGQFSNYNLYNDLMTGQTRLPFVNNGGLVEAQYGLQVGDEIELSENDIMELAKYGYEITRV